jgi:hypothetical protein
VKELSFLWFLVSLIFCQFCAAEPPGEVDIGFSTTPQLSAQQIESLPAETRKQMDCNYFKTYTMLYLAETMTEGKVDVKPSISGAFAAVQRDCEKRTPEQTMAGFNDFYSPGGVGRINGKLFEAMERGAKEWEQKALGRVEAQRPLALISPETIREEFAPGMPAALALKELFPNLPPLEIQPISGLRKAIVLLKRMQWDWIDLSIGGAALMGIISFLYRWRRQDAGKKIDKIIASC